LKLFNWFKSKPVPPKKKESRVAKLHVSSGGAPVYSDKDYEKFCKETYLKNVIAFRCIHEIAKSACEPRWELHRRMSDEETELVNDHEMNNLLRRANPAESWSKMIYRTVCYLLMTGNAFPERVRAETRAGKYPLEMYSLRPDRITLIPNERGLIASYLYTTSAGSQKFDVDPITMQGDLLHISLFHPLNDFWGAAPIEPAARDIDTSNDATDWNKCLIQNQGRPGMVFTLIGEIADDDFDRIERMIDEKFSGPSQAGKSMIITGDSGTKAEPYTLSLADMEFLEGGRELARRIALAFGVPPILLGIPGDSTYNNRKEARLEFYESTVFFYVNLIRNELNNWLFDPKDRLLLKCNYDDVSALEPRWETKWKRAQEADFLTINEKREMTGYDQTDDGDVILVNSGMVPLSQAVMELDMTGIEEQVNEVVVDEKEFSLVMGLNE